MKPTGLLAATGVLAVLGGLVYWTTKHPKEAASTAATSPKILTVTDDQIEGIRVSKPGSDPVVLKKLANTWAIAEPKNMAADQDVVHQMTAGLAGLTSDRLIDEHPTDLNGFGLSTPSEEVDVTVKGGAVHKLLLGSDTPTSADTYVKLDSKPAVYTVPSSTKSNFDKSVNDLRDKRLVTFNSDKVTSIMVTSKGPAFEFGKNGQGEWQITKPKPYRADSMQIDDFVRKLKDAKMDLSAAGPFAGGTKLASVAVTDNTGTQTLDVFKAKDNSFYASSSAAQGTYKLTGDLADALKDKDVDSFRNKKLFDFGFTDPTKVEINGAAYTKAGDKWNGPAGSVNPGSVQTVIDKLRDLSAIKLSEKPAGTQAISLAVTSGDNHKVEKVILNKAADEFNAVREGDPTIYRIDGKAADDLQKAIAGIRK